VQVTPSLAINYTAYGTLRSHWLDTYGADSHTVRSPWSSVSLANFAALPLNRRGRHAWQIMRSMPLSGLPATRPGSQDILQVGIM
jgi:hypothetical protein